MFRKGIITFMFLLSMSLNGVSSIAYSQNVVPDTTPKARELTRRDFILHTYNPNTEIISMYYKDAIPTGQFSCFGGGVICRNLCLSHNLQLTHGEACHECDDDGENAFDNHERIRMNE